MPVILPSDVVRSGMCSTHRAPLPVSLGSLSGAWETGSTPASGPINRAKGLKWHEDAETCRERIRKTISMGSGCSAVSHMPDDPVADDPRWTEELAALRRQQPGEWASSTVPDSDE